MSAPQPNDEFDAARIVVDVLKNLQPDEQTRAIRWAQEKLGVIGSTTLRPGDTRGVRQSDPRNARHELSGVLNDPQFLQHHAAVDRMLHVLSAASMLKPNVFDRVLVIRGRGRRYFAKSAAEIANSGKSTQPRSIPGTEYWVMTNSPTPQKREMLEKALRLLGFTGDAIRDAVAAIE